MPQDESSGSRSFTWEDHFYGAVTVGERGQVVIPASARKRFAIEPGDKVLILGDPGKRALMLCKIDSLREFMNAFQEGLERVERDMVADQNESDGDNHHHEHNSNGSGSVAALPVEREDDLK